MVKVVTANSIYLLNDEDMVYYRSPLKNRYDPRGELQDPLFRNLKYEDWRPMDNWTITDEDQLLIAYPDSQCPHDGTETCQGNHFILTSIVTSVENVEK